MNETNNNTNDPGEAGPPPRDELDALLRAWHQQSAEQAYASKDALMRAVNEQTAAGDSEPAQPNVVTEDVQGRATPAAGRGVSDGARARRWQMMRRLIVNRYSPIAAGLILAAVLIPVLLPSSEKKVLASDVIMAPEGGRLDALDKEGNIIGPCPLQHTDVQAEVTGRFVRVALTQKYKNPYPDKIEAVYTFPMSHRAAVDRMKMVVGDRVVVGEVHERQRARAIYEAARRQGYVASLLEQERPNIFTQSVANIEPGAEIEIEISYVELLESKDGTFTFDFPMVVGPRYIPGSPPTTAGQLPDGLAGRRGVILLGPGELTVGEAGDVSKLNTLQTGKLKALIHAAVPTTSPDPQWWEKSFGRGDEERAEESAPATQPAAQAASQPADAQAEAKPALWYKFSATYCNGAQEFGELYNNRTGQLNGRWFYFDPAVIEGMGTGFSPDTTQVPDASRITPEPVKPGKRAGHDISVEVLIDTGGPGIRELKPVLHEIARVDERNRSDGLPSRVRVALRNEVEIPNRDFVLNWKQTADTIEEATFTHTGKLGNFFTLILQPPERVEDDHVVPRELVFVLDSSGSMSGFPIEKAKEVMGKAIDGLRPQDTFNLITFSGDTHILWDKPRPFTEANRKEAQDFLASRKGSGGTEMMKAINAALVQTATSRSQDPADRPAGSRSHTGLGTGSKHGGDDQAPAPIRVCCFMTDGYVGNDMAIIDAVKENADTTRVFSFGIGNSVNRFLLDGMARAGRGEVEYVLLQSDADEAAKRFTKRIQTPVLTDIALEFSDGLKSLVTGLVPRRIPDLFDAKPLIVHGQYTGPCKGTMTIRGNTGSGPYTRAVDLDLPESQAGHDVIATLWARAKVEELTAEDLAAIQQKNYPQELQDEIVRLGERFSIMTQFTSFVAVEKSRITIGGEPKLVAVPIEMPEGVSYEGVFGCASNAAELLAADKADDLMAVLTPEALLRVTTTSIEDLPDGTKRQTLKVQHTNTTAVAEALRAVMSKTQRSGGATPKDAPPLSVVANAKTGELVLTGNQADLEMAQKLVRKIDRSAMSTLLRVEVDAPTAVIKQQRLDLAGDNKAATLEVKEPIYLGYAGSGPGGAMGGAGMMGGMGGYGGGGYGGYGGMSYGFQAAAPGQAGQVTGRQADLFRLLQSGATTPPKSLVCPSTNGPAVAAQPAPAAEPVPRRFTQLGFTPAVPAAKPGTVNGAWYYDDALGRAKARLEEGGGSAEDLLDYSDLDGDGVVSEGERAAAQALPPFLRERTALAVARLVKESKIDEARKLAEALVKFDAKYEIGVKMRDTLADGSLSAAQRDKRIAELAEQAARPIEAVMRDAKIRSRLDPRLYQLVKREEAKPEEVGVALVDGGIRVTILAPKLDEAMLSAMKTAGLSVEGTQKAHGLVIGVAPREKLGDLALLDAVRKIEPSKLD